MLVYWRDVVVVVSVHLVAALCLWWVEQCVWNAHEGERNAKMKAVADLDAYMMTMLLLLCCIVVGRWWADLN